LHRWPIFSDLILNSYLCCPRLAEKREISMMRKLRRALFCTLAVSLAGGPVLGQGMSMTSSVKPGEPATKVIAENEKLRVLDVVDRPGDVSAPTVRQGRVVHWITGGKLERTFADGTKEVLTRKGGETTLITEKRPYSVKNIGTTSVHLVEVELK
jgi:hypothetical protein